MTSARCGKPPGCSTPNAAVAAPLGSKSESCAIVTPSFSRNAAGWGHGVAGDGEQARALGGEVVQDLLVEVQLVGADRREGERIEDQDRRLARQVGAGEVLAVPRSSA